MIEITELQWSGVGAIAIGLLYTYRSNIYAMLKSKKTVAPSVLPILPSQIDDVADMQAYRRLEARADRSGCPNFKDAIATVAACFFEKAGNHDEE